MPRYLALEWGRAGIRGLDAEVTGNAVDVRASLDHDWPEELDAARDPEGVGSWLKSRIVERQAGDRRLIVLVPREDIVGRLLALPEASDEALPDLVRYQTGTRSSVPLDQLAIDYLPLASAPPEGGRWVQTAAVPDRLLQHIKACAKVAELDLCAVGATTLAIREAISHTQPALGLPSDQKSLILRLVGEQLEVALWRGPDLLFSHVSRTTDTNAVVVEVQRALMSHQGIAGEGPIARAWLISPPECEAELRNALASRLSCDVSGFDVAGFALSPDVPSRLQVAGLPTNVGPYAATLGALLGSVQPTIPAVDFLNPRRRVAKPDRTKMIAAVTAGTLLIILLAGYLGSRLYLNSLEGSIAERERTIREQDASWRTGEPTRAAAEFLSSWESRRVDWLEQMRLIGAELPGTERVYLDRWRFDLTTGQTRGTTEAIGFARERADKERLTQQLAERAGFRIRPNPSGAASNDPEYPILLQLNAELASPKRRPAGNKRE